MPSESNTEINILIAGPVGRVCSLKVGKSTLSRALSGDFTQQQYKVTIGLDFQEVTLSNNHRVKIWDSAGQEKFEMNNVLIAPDIILFCLDATSYHSKRDITAAKKHIHDLYVKDQKNPPIWIFIVTQQDTEVDVHDLTLPPDLKKEGFKNICFVSRARPQSIELLKELLYKKSVERLPYVSMTPVSMEFILESLKEKTTNSPEICSALDTLFNQFNAAQLNQQSLLEFKTKYETLLDTLKEENVDKPQLVNAFVGGMQDMLSASGTKGKYAIGALGTAILVTLLAGCLGFAIGFACGIWAGPAALFTGIIGASAASIALVSAASGAGVCSGVGVAAYGLFQQPEWRVDLKPLKQALNLSIMG